MSVYGNLLHQRVQALRILGSSVMSLVWVACGRADAFVIGIHNEGGKPWDYCAGVCESECGWVGGLVGARVGARFGLQNCGCGCGCVGLGHWCTQTNAHKHTQGIALGGRVAWFSTGSIAGAMREIPRRQHPASIFIPGRASRPAPAPSVTRFFRAVNRMALI